MIGMTRSAIQDLLSGDDNPGPALGQSCSLRLLGTSVRHIFHSGKATQLVRLMGGSECFISDALHLRRHRLPWHPRKYPTLSDSGTVAQTQ